MWPKTPSGCFFALLFVVAVIAVLGGAFGWFSDLLIDPGSKIPDPGQIHVPGVK